MKVASSASLQGCCAGRDAVQAEELLGELQKPEICPCVQDLEAGVPSSNSSESEASSPRGPKGGGTLKTCAVCIEDYRRASICPTIQCWSCT